MAIPNVLHPLAHVGIIRFSIVFQKVCSKEVNPYEIAWLKQYVVETLCILEYWFPPSFWDIMSHLVIHLMNELAICKPMVYVDVSCGEISR